MGPVRSPLLELKGDPHECPVGFERADIPLRARTPTAPRQRRTATFSVLCPPMGRTRVVGRTLPRSATGGRILSEVEPGGEARVDP
jgi:hypothetical protein